MTTRTREHFKGFCLPDGFVAECQPVMHRFFFAFFFYPSHLAEGAG